MKIVTGIGDADPLWTLLDDPALVLAADPCPAHLHLARLVGRAFERDRDPPAATREHRRGPRGDDLATLEQGHPRTLIRRDRRDPDSAREVGLRATGREQRAPRPPPPEMHAPL